jgi:cytoskeletal protein CcmA (bactofilin family)
MKFSLTKTSKTVFGIKFFQIKAESNFGNISKGDLGGWVEKKENVSDEGNAWVYGDAQVSGNARVYGDARVSGDARVYGDARVSGDAQVSGNARVYGDAQVSGNARVYGDARVSGDAQVSGNAWVSGDAWVYGNARVYGDARVYGSIKVSLGFFFGFREKSENLTMKDLGDVYELIGKGECKFEEEEMKLSGKKVKVTLDGKEFTATID